MSGSEVIKRPSARVDTKGGIKSIRVAIRDLWGRQTRNTTTELRLPDGNGSVEEIARKVFQQIQQLPNEHENPEAALFELARRVIDDGAAGQSQTVLTIAEPIAEYDRMKARMHLEAAWNELDGESRIMMSMHVYEGCTYRDIARRLHMPTADGERHVLDTLKVAYAQLRARTSDPDPVTTGESASQ